MFENDDSAIEVEAGGKQNYFKLPFTETDITQGFEFEGTVRLNLYG